MTGIAMTVIGAIVMGATIVTGVETMVSKQRGNRVTVTA
jgi:hypothetical protein